MLSNSQGQKNRLEILPVLGMGVQGLLYQDNLCNIQLLQGTVIIQTNFIHISVLSNIFLFSKILSILIYTVAWETENFNKRNFFVYKTKK